MNNLDDFTPYKKKIKPKNYTKPEKLICDWTDKKKYLIRYGMLKFYIKHGMMVVKLHEIKIFRQSKWLEK